MERHPNQNAFTWKKMKPTVCITAQYKSMIMMDFKVKEGAESMSIPSTVGRGRLGYIDAISEMIDFRKLHGASEAVLRKFSATELYLKRARKTVAKMMRLQWTQDLDIETLEARGHWATMEELLEVV